MPSRVGRARSHRVWRGRAGFDLRDVAARCATCATERSSRGCWGWGWTVACWGNVSPRPVTGVLGGRVGTEGGYVSVDNRRFRRAGRVRGAVLLAAAVLGVAGCSGSTEGSPTAVESVAASPESGQTSGAGSAAASTTAKSEGAGLWDPCAMPESAIGSTGMDAASKESGIANTDFSEAGWEACKWRATDGWYWLTVFSGTPTLDEVKAREGFTDFAPLTVGSRQAVQYRPEGAGNDVRCTVAVELQQGVALFAATARASTGAKEDMCVVAGRHAADLADQLPE
ncbi:DUF3558 domain-containing protein [Nocardia sp. NPDC059180]|uniref:DUF3558 domain-containing protein n=1 Tax=Nocardia sp. NPDC059180 TaxID=3346761 RepID=UPI0036ADABB3